MKITIIAAGLLIVASAVPALASDACLLNRDVDGWGTRDAHTLVVNDRFARKYLVSVAGWCQDLDFSMGISIRSFGGGSSCVDRGDRIVMHGAGAMDRHGLCTITKIERYTPEMEKAYKDALEAKKHQHAD